MLKLGNEDNRVFVPKKRFTAGLFQDYRKAENLTTTVGHRVWRVNAYG
jgi:hypothetical protein